jgi:hypothetical protein
LPFEGKTGAVQCYRIETRINWKKGCRKDLLNYNPKKFVPKFSTRNIQIYAGVKIGFADVIRHIADHENCV